MNGFTKISFLFCFIILMLLVGCKPIVTIIAPANGDIFATDEEITFEGQATDQQHPDLSDDAFVWTSDKDGEIGTSASFTSGDLSEGQHTITLTVTDPDGLSGESSVSITVGNGGDPTSTTTIKETTPTTTTTIEAAGQRFQDNGDGTVTDSRTGLIWLKNANPCGTKNWYDVRDYCSNLADGTAGLTDGSVVGKWGLPSIEELEGIGTDPPATWGEGYPNVTWTTPREPFTGMCSFYWSSSTVAINTDLALAINMDDDGYVSNYCKIDSYLCVWPVRANTTTTILPAGQRFQDNGDGTVTDSRTGLIWLKNANPCGKKNGDDAWAYCSNLADGTAGLTDGSVVGQWRLPWMAELEGIGTDPPATWGEGYPNVTWTTPGEPFTEVQSYGYWSSSQRCSSTAEAWIVNMNSGEVNWGFKSNSFVYVWPVRSGQ